MTSPEGLADIPDLSLYGVLRRAEESHRERAAYTYLDHTVDYAEYLARTDDLSLRFRAMGIGEGDRAIICLPNCPQAVLSFYALNRIGAVSVMVHPLSSSSEIRHYIDDSGAKIAITLNRFIGIFPEINEKETLRTLIVPSPVDMLPTFKGRIGKLLKKDLRVPKLAEGSGMLSWTDLLRKDISAVSGTFPDVAPDSPAVILYTGGTTGTNKGAVHTNRAVNECAVQMIEGSSLMDEGKLKILAQLPIFHGFGLCTCIHVPVCVAAECVLLPLIRIDEVCRTIVKKRVNYFAGVPGMLIKMIDNPAMKDADLSCLIGVFCGGDILPSEYKKRFDAFLKDHGSETFVRVGYGCTEMIAAACLTDRYEERTGSCGKPLPGYSAKIVRIGTTEQVPNGETGEICVAGPSMMSEYLGRPEETAEVLRKHDDGIVWCHTGDAGYIDDEGHVYFVNRIKRIIITSGYNVYPSQIEDALDRHPAVDCSCVVGRKDPERGETVVAFIVLRDEAEASEETKASISDYLKKEVALYARPREYRFVDSLPRTKLGKVDYRQLEESL